MGRKIKTRESIWYNIINYGFEMIGRHYSSYRAFVVNNEDPLGMNRLQLLIPHLNESAPDDTWAFPKNVFGGKNYGTQLLPQKGDMVWVEFEYGDPDYPIWSHAGYGEEELPKEFQSVNHYGFKTPQGTLILINDNDDNEEVLIKHATTNEWLKIIKDEFELESKVIKLGKNGDEAGVLGDTLKGKLDDLTDKVNDLIQIMSSHTHAGPTGPPIKATQILNIKTNITSIKDTYKEFLSKKIKIDK